jgi:hypothetical protein
MNDLWQTGAEPIDLTAARLLWKSPWWAKALESMDDVDVSERDFIVILGRLYRDCIRLNKCKIDMHEFADLASMARKVRWKNIRSQSFGPKHLGLILKKLGFLEWNPLIARFEFKPSLCQNLAGSLVLKPWDTLSKEAKRRQGARVRRWKKEHKEDRQVERLERDIRVSKMVVNALADGSTPQL